MEEGEERLGKIEAVLSPAFEAHGLTLVDVQWLREGRRRVLRLFVDKPGGISIADCQRLSGEVGDLLDVSGLVEEPYDLEVSSPGLERELRKDREFAWAVGKEMRCWLREPLEGRRELAGRLVGFTPERLILVEREGHTSEVPRHLVAKARLELVAPRRR